MNTEPTEFLNDEQVDKLKEADAKFIFDQAEKQLKDVLETSSVIVSRTATLITITIGLTVALLGFVFNRMNANSFCDHQIIAASCGIIYLYGICFYLRENIKGHEYATIGDEPKSLGIDYFFNEKIKDEQRIIEYYYACSANYQTRIRNGKETNNKRWGIYDRSLLLLIFLPAFVIAVFIIL